MGIALGSGHVSFQVLLAFGHEARQVEVVRWLVAFANEFLVLINDVLITGGHRSLTGSHRP